MALLAVLLPAAAAATSKPDERRLTKEQATELFVAYPKVASWLERYPPEPVTDATFESGTWTVMVWSGDAGEIATGKVDDVTGRVLEAWTGPQVAWKMARGGKGAFGGRQINSYKVWLGLCAAFLLGLVDWRRLFSVRNLDLLALLSFSVSLWFFNRGDVFTAMPLVYPGLVWLLARSLWIGRSDRASRGGVVWPIWVLAAATVFLAGFRVMLNVRSSNVIDVGYAGVIGADRIWRGQSPYGNFPVEEDLPKCGPADSSGEVRDRIQTNGRCENANPNGDTYGPVLVHRLPAGLPRLRLDREVGRPARGARDDDPLGPPRAGRAGAARAAARRAEGRAATRGDARVRVGGVAVHAVRVELEHERPDPAGAADLGLLLREHARPARRLPRVRLVGEVRAAAARPALERLPRHAAPAAAGSSSSWASRSRPRSRSRCSCSTGPSGMRPASSGTARSRRRSAASRRSRSGTGGSTTRRASPTCTWSRSCSRCCSCVGALALWRWPRRRSPLQLAAFTAALLIGFELVLTHWFFLYLPWFFPFVAIALLWERPPPRPVVEEADEQPERVLVAT